MWICSKREGQISDVYKKLGQGTRVYGGEEKYKFRWSRSEEGRNRVGIIVRENLVEEVIKLKDWLGRKILQQGRPDEEKRKFLEKLSDNIHNAAQEDLLGGK